MEGTASKVIYQERARLAIRDFAIFIEEKGYPLTAEKFAQNLFAFGNSLNIFPKKFGICKEPSLKSHLFRCAIFKKDYIFIYKIIGDDLIVYNVIHTSRYVY